MLDKTKKVNMFYLFLFLTFLTVYATSFFIADSYAHFTSKVEFQGELLTEEDFGIQIEPPIKEEKEEIVEEVKDLEEAVQEEHDGESSNPAEEKENIESPEPDEEEGDSELTEEENKEESSDLDKEAEETEEE
jgi:hypothetical protein